jgi:hypothetical protein
MPDEPGSELPKGEFKDPLALRLSEWVEKAELLRKEGLPMPVDQVRGVVEHLRSRGEAVRAEQALARAERLLERAQDDWKLLRELLRRIDELKELAGKAGLDLSEFDARLGNPRELLKGTRLSEGMIEQAMGVASKALAVLNDVIPKYTVAEAKKLSQSIRLARDRGEDVSDAAERLAQFLNSLRAGQLRGTASAFLELRRSVAQIPREPTVPLLPRDEEEEILREATHLARRLKRMKTHARDASSAARLMSQVKAALAEERRFATPEEEVQELWDEVERVTHERMEATSVPPEREKPPATKVPELDPSQVPPELIEAANGPLDGTVELPSSSRRARRPKG